MNDEAKFARIEALLHATAERGNQMELRFNRRMDRAEQRMGKAELRMEKFDRRLEASHKLIMTGMRMFLKRDEETKAIKEEIRELVKAQKAYLDSMRRSSGNGHRRVN